MSEPPAVEQFLLPEADGAPNNDRLPLILYRAAVDPGDDEPEAAFERVFARHNWGNGFRGDTFPFHHYHSAAHEVVGIARGKAEVQFGGPNGPVVAVKAGDAVVIPAGVSHRRLDDTPGYSSVGAYPPGQTADLCVLSERDARSARQQPGIGDLAPRVIGDDELPATRASIAATALPETDPLLGESGPITTAWRSA